MNRQRILIAALSLAAALGARIARAETTADPAAQHPLTLEEATKGLKSSGSLMAKIEVDQGGKAMGTFVCELFDAKAPKTVANFVGLARGLRPWLDPKSGQWVKKPLYDGLTFHRVIPDFMIQGGDPKGNGTGDPGYTFEDEFDQSLVMDKPGLLAMANRGPATNGSQFFITEKGAPWLTGKYTIFGQCQPLDLEMKIARVAANNYVPAEKVVMKKVTISRGSLPSAKKK
jgi:peptidyl-prolyl cis-trans isomerase A (cyclophilin A)